MPWTWPIREPRRFRMWTARWSTARFVETGGHGTHVPSIAAGDGSPVDTCDFPFTFVGVAPEADLIVVGGRLSTDTYVREAVQYIFSRAAGAQPSRRWST